MTDAPNYNDGLWHGWNGGECPVDTEATVECACANGRTGDPIADLSLMERPAWSFDWDGSPSDNSLAVIAFRVKPSPPQPRTIYLCEDPGLIPTIHKTAIDATKAALSYGPGATVSEWREVLS